MNGQVDTVNAIKNGTIKKVTYTNKINIHTGPRNARAGATSIRI